MRSRTALASGDAGSISSVPSTCPVPAISTAADQLRTIARAVDDVGVGERRELRGDLSVAVVTGAAIARQVSEHGARLRIVCGDARRCLPQRRIRSREQTLVEQRLQRHHVRRQRLAVNRVRVAVVRQLQGIEAERTARLAVAGRAVAARRDVVLAPWRDLHRAGDAVGLGEHGVGSFLVPHVAARKPSGVRRLPQEPRFDRTAGEAELLPQPRADGKFPLARVAGVDRGAGGQVDPPPLGGTVGPERVLRRERAIARGDDAAAVRREEPRFREVRR